ncbi:MAG: 5-deoxy-glucuronate isomerase [Humibacillus sp.]
MTNHYRADSLATSDTLVTVTPEQAGWNYCGLEVFDLASGPFQRVLEDIEGVLVPLSATDVEVSVDGETHTLRGRTGVFEAVSDWTYLPLGADLRVSGKAGEVALCTARASERFPLCVTPAHEVPVEVRGGGRASRQVTNIATPDSFTGADRINVCEVLTPGGNVSSWPPHRHDGIGDCEPTNEEIYYFRMGRLDEPHGHPHGQGLFRVYTVDGSSDETVTVLDGDVHIVAAGYHGPSTAQPEYPMYFLNVLAGPGVERTMAFCDDPDHHWIRETWEQQGQDPRLPLTSAAGRVTR